MSNTVVYLHSDHLSSVSVATSASGAKLSEQEFDPWGKLYQGGVGQTRLSYTGQQRDDRGLLYYHARYYDPRLARFISPDSIVPGAADLIVDHHEVGIDDMGWNNRAVEAHFVMQALEATLYGP